MTDKLKKQLILNLPYLIFVYLFDKLCQGVRLAPGSDASEKLLHIGQGFSAAFASLAPSFHLLDLCVGAAGAVLIRLAVYSKGKTPRNTAAASSTGVPVGAHRPISLPMWIRTSPKMFSSPKRSGSPCQAAQRSPSTPGTKISWSSAVPVAARRGSSLSPTCSNAIPRMWVTDPKGTILQEVGALLERRQYRIKSLNLINFKKSMKYNPLAYIRSEKDILKLVNALITLR